MQKNIRQFAPISKTEAQSDGTLKVWGVASTEAVDTDGEVIKASAMKAALPAYMEFGAIREMHQPIAAGTCLEAGVNAETGATLICAHIVDSGSILKVKTGVLKGFSIGGVATKTDPMDKRVITELDLNEISLVDKPANPQAIISLWKAAKMSTSAQVVGDVTGEQVGDEIESLVLGGGLSLGEVLLAIQKAAKAKKDEMCAHGVAKKDYTKDERTGMAAKGEAMPDGSYPIKDKEDLKNAVQAYGRAKDKPATKKHIETRAKALDAEDLLPEKWDESTKMGDDDGDKSGADKDKKAGAVAPAGGTQEPAGVEVAQKANKARDSSQSFEKTQGNAEVNEVGMGARGPADAVVSMQAPGTSGTGNPQATPGMLPETKPKIGDLASIKWGEDEISGEITELEEGGAFKIQNGDAWLTADATKLIHHEMVGDKVNWVLSPEANADFTAVKAARNSTAHEALQKINKGAAGKPIKKGMWTVSDWAGMLQSCVCLHSNIQWEGVCEEDDEDSTIAKELAIWIKQGAELWLTYAKDEVQELLLGVADPDNMDAFLVELASKTGELQKFAEGTPTVAAVLKKAFGDAQDAEKLNKVIGKAVDTAVELALEKAAKEHKTQLENLSAEVEKLKAQPAAMKGVLKTVSKGGDSGSDISDVKPITKNDGSVDEVATEIKKAFSNPKQFTRTTF